MDAGFPAADQRKLALTRRAAAGDNAALKLLVTESRDDVCAHISERIPADLRRVVDAEDIVEEAEIDVFRRIRAFEPRSPESFHRWFTTVALSHLRDAIRWQRAAQRGPARASHGAVHPVEDLTIALLDLVSPLGCSPSRSVSRSKALDAVRRALSVIPENCRRALRLIYIEGRPTAAVAAAMGRTERAIHSLCRRGLSRLREQLSGVVKLSGWSD